VSAIDAEVRIGREYDRLGERLAYSDEAGIGETHRDVRVLLHETQDTVELVSETERGDNGAPTKKRAEGRPAPRPEKVERLGENGIAGARRPSHGRFSFTSSSGPEYAKLRIRLMPGSSTRGPTPQMNASS